LGPAGPGKGESGEELKKFFERATCLGSMQERTFREIPVMTQGEGEGVTEAQRVPRRETGEYKGGNSVRTAISQGKYKQTYPGREKA